MRRTRGVLGPEVADQYVTLLLERRRQEAVELVGRLAADGADVRDIYLGVLAPAQQSIGGKWQHNEITVAQEHFCTAATQQAIAALYPYVFAGEPDGRRAVVACVSGELHELGARMVADFLQLDGWDTTYLSANVPLQAIVDEAVAVDAHLLACSIALPDKVPFVEQTIALVREVRPDLRVMVGGRVFNTATDLWRMVGADGWAHDAEGAVEQAAALVPHPTGAMT